MDPGSLIYAGALDHKTFENLQKMKVLDERFDGYSDFRWGTAVIMQNLQKIIALNLLRDKDVQKLLALLDLAAEHNCGLMVYGD